MANGVTSQWEDIHVQLGNFVARDKDPDQKDLNLKAQETIEKEGRPFQDKTEEEMDSLEDEFGEDQFYKQYKLQKMLMVEINKGKAVYGSLNEISRQDYVGQVTNAAKQSFVVLHLYQNYNEYCMLLNELIVGLAPQYPLVKFLKIVSTRCVEDFPDSNLPCFIIYQAGKLISNVSCVHQYLKEVDSENLERFLHGQGVIFNEKFLDKNEKLIEAKSYLQNPYTDGKSKKEIDPEIDDEEDDRDYSNQQIKSLKFR